MPATSSNPSNPEEFNMSVDVQGPEETDWVACEVPRKPQISKGNPEPAGIHLSEMPGIFIYLLLLITCFAHSAIHAWAPNIEKIAAHTEYTRLREMLGSSQEEINRIQESIDMTVAEIEELVDEFSSFPNERFQFRHLTGDWELIGSLGATEFHAKNPRKDKMMEEVLRTGGFNFKYPEGIVRATNYHYRRLPTGLKRREEYPLGYFPDNRWVDNCLVLSGWSTKVALCLKQGRLQITETENGVKWHRFYKRSDLS